MCRDCVQSYVPGWGVKVSGGVTFTVGEIEGVVARG
jgi:hypothetical protein